MALAFELISGRITADAEVSGVGLGSELAQQQLESPVKSRSPPYPTELVILSRRRRTRFTGCGKN
jgi:hypothetical protein